MVVRAPGVHGGGGTRAVDVLRWICSAPGLTVMACLVWVEG